MFQKRNNSVKRSFNYIKGNRKKMVNCCDYQRTYSDDNCGAGRNVQSSYNARDGTVNEVYRFGDVHAFANTRNIVNVSGESFHELSHVNVAHNDHCHVASQHDGFHYVPVGHMVHHHLNTYPEEDEYDLTTEHPQNIRTFMERGQSSPNLTRNVRTLTEPCSFHAKNHWESGWERGNCEHFHRTPNGFYGSQAIQAKMQQTPLFGRFHETVNNHGDYSFTIPDSSNIMNNARKQSYDTSSVDVISSAWNPDLHSVACAAANIEEYESDTSILSERHVGFRNRPYVYPESPETSERLCECRVPFQRTCNCEREEENCTNSACSSFDGQDLYPCPNQRHNRNRLAYDYPQVPSNFSDIYLKADSTNVAWKSRPFFCSSQSFSPHFQKVHEKPCDEKVVQTDPYAYQNGKPCFCHVETTSKDGMQEAGTPTRFSDQYVKYKSGYISRGVQGENVAGTGDAVVSSNFCSSNKATAQIPAKVQTKPSTGQKSSITKEIEKRYCHCETSDNRTNFGEPSQNVEKVAYCIARPPTKPCLCHAPADQVNKQELIQLMSKIEDNIINKLEEIGKSRDPPVEYTRSFILTKEKEVQSPRDEVQLQKESAISFEKELMSPKEDLMSQKGSVTAQKGSEISIKKDSLSQKEEVLSKKEDVITQKEEVLSRKEEVLSQKADVLSQKEDVLSQKADVLSQKEDVLSHKERLISLKEEVFNKEKESTLIEGRTHGKVFTDEDSLPRDSKSSETMYHSKYLDDDEMMKVKNSPFNLPSSDETETTQEEQKISKGKKRKNRTSQQETPKRRKRRKLITKPRRIPDGQRTFKGTFKEKKTSRPQSPFKRRSAVRKTRTPRTPKMSSHQVFMVQQTDISRNSRSSQEFSEQHRPSYRSEIVSLSGQETSLSKQILMSASLCKTYKIKKIMFPSPKKHVYVLMKKKHRDRSSSSTYKKIVKSSLMGGSETYIKDKTKKSKRNRSKYDKSRGRKNHTKILYI